MASSGYKSMPSVPRGLSRELESFLGSVSSNVSKLIGAARNSSGSRAVTISESRNIISGGSSSSTEQSAIYTYMLKDKSVTSSKLADNAVTSEKIDVSAVLTRNMAAKAVTSDILGDYSVESSKIKDGSVISAKIADGAIVRKHIADNAVATAHIAESAVTSEKIADGSVSPEKLSDGVLMQCVTGECEDGDLVRISGVWSEKPVVCITGIRSIVDMATDSGNIVGVDKLTEQEENPGVWAFTSVGAFSWAAFGRQIHESV